MDLSADEQEQYKNAVPVTLCGNFTIPLEAIFRTQKNFSQQMNLFPSSMLLYTDASKKDNFAKLQPAEASVRKSYKIRRETLGSRK